MAKKTKRPQAKPAAKTAKTAAPLPIIDSAPVATPSEAPRVPRTPKVSRSQAAAERLEDEYSYITGDLRRVFLLAAAMFALLIVVNLVFTMIG